MKTYMIDHTEKINSLISNGTGLPPVNPYLDDQTDPDIEMTAKEVGGKNKRSKNVAVESKPMQGSKHTTIAPDPKEYIAELERPEEENLF